MNYKVKLIPRRFRLGGTVTHNPKEIARAVRDINRACHDILAQKRRGDKSLNGDGETLEQRIAGVKEMYDRLPADAKKQIKFDVNKL